MNKYNKTEKDSQKHRKKLVVARGEVSRKGKIGKWD